MAIYIALSTLGIKAEDGIVVSPMACLASTQPLLSMGIKVQWADVDPCTGTLYPDSVNNSITANTKAIIHNHYCGNVGYIDEINNIGKKYGIPVIDDGIEAFGSEYKDRKIGNVGTDATIFSFNPVRIPNTLDGGAVVFKDDALYQKSKLLRDAGINRSLFRDSLGEINPDCDIELVGYSATPVEINSYIGIQQMKNVDRILEIQRGNALAWDNRIRNENEIKPIKKVNSKPNYWVYGALCTNKKDTIVKYRDAAYYASGVHINNSIYSVFGSSDTLPGVNEFYNKFIALPCGWWMETSDI